MTGPRITVGVPFFNEERHLAEAVESVLRQSAGDFELLLIDDGSTDGSNAIAARFERDPRVRLLSDGRQKGLPARLNEVVRLARGHFIARMDADDISHPDRFARELRCFEQDSSLDAVGTWAALIDANRRPFAVVEAGGEAPTLRRALERGLLIHASVVGRAAWFRAHVYDESLDRAEDRDLWCRTARSSRFGVVPEPLYLARVLPQGERFVDDYLESQRQNRVLLGKYGRSAVGAARTMGMQLGSHAKSVAMSLAFRAGLGERLVRRRGRPPTARELAIIQEAQAGLGCNEPR